MKANYEVDLHCHTTRSDGADTPRELIVHAAERGVKVLAITDHDIRPPQTIDVDGIAVDAVAYAAQNGITLLRGIEVSCETTVEDCHIVCFGCDWTDSYFDVLEQNVIASKIESYRELTVALTEAGMPVFWAEVLDNGGNPVTEDKVQKKMIFECMARKGFAADWSAAKLLVKNTPAFQILRRKPDPCEVIREVHRCGGIAIMAHPYLIAEPVLLDGTEMSRSDYIERLIAAGLDGIEACYSYAKTSYGGTMNAAEIEDEVRSRYAHRLQIISGGSDYHADAKKNAKKVREIGECGITLDAFSTNSLLKCLTEGQ